MFIRFRDNESKKVTNDWFQWLAVGESVKEILNRIGFTTEEGQERGVEYEILSVQEYE